MIMKPTETYPMEVDCEALADPQFDMFTGCEQMIKFLICAVTMYLEITSVFFLTFQPE